VHRHFAVRAVQEHDEGDTSNEADRDHAGRDAPMAFSFSVLPSKSTST